MMGRQDGTAPGVAFVECTRCGAPISAIAAECPQCGQRVGPAPTATKTRGRTARPLLIVGAAGLITLAAGYYVFTHGAGESASRFASAVGVPIVPWTDRAQTQAEDLYMNMGDKLAARMLDIIHPDAQGARLVSHATTVEDGGILVSHFEIAWKIGEPPTKNTTLIEWRCSEGGSATAVIGGDSATSSVTPKNAERLSDYLRTSIFQPLKRNAN
jgi:hypothetical protein